MGRQVATALGIGISGLVAAALAALPPPVARCLLREHRDDPGLFGLAQGMRGMTTPALIPPAPMGDDQGVMHLLRSAVVLVLCGLSAASAQPRGDALAGLLARRGGGVGDGISSREVRAFELPAGSSLDFTAVAVKGTDLAKGARETIEVTISAGLIDQTRGVHRSTAPLPNATLGGRRMLRSRGHMDEVAESLSGDALVDGRGGLFTWCEGRRGETIVQGGGRGSAIERNVRLPDLRDGLRRQRTQPRQRR